MKALMRTHMRRLPRLLASIPFWWSAVALLLIQCSGAPVSDAQSAPPKKLEISRPARPWEFLAAVGKRAGLLGNETGKVEAWVYPLKILRDLQLTKIGRAHV